MEGSRRSEVSGGVIGMGKRKVKKGIVEEGRGSGGSYGKGW